MKDTFTGWAKVNQFELGKVVDLIVTGCTVNQAKPDTWLSEFLGDADKNITLLDFGCGVGRNAIGLALKHPNWTIVGYDSDQMISHVPEFVAINYNGKVPDNLYFVTDWDQICQRKFDKVMAVIVLQHIYEEPLKKYCQDFKKITKFLMVHGRRFNDDKDKRSTWSIMEEAGLIPKKFMAGHVEIPYSPEGDPNEHNIAYYYL